MTATRSRGPRAVWPALACAGLLAVGCTATVQQDRSITFSADGQSVGFAHDEEGVFVVDQDSGRREKIFATGPDILCASAPRWAPTGRRLIFTAVRTPKDAPRPPVPVETPPDGALFGPRDVVYTCYLRETPPDGQPASPPKPLFEAHIGHPGYVAADLAVRWHPAGDRILFVDQSEGSRYALSVYDLRTKATRRAFPHTADDLVFDGSPDGKYLACTLANAQPDESDGLWVGVPGANDWWHVPDSAVRETSELPGTLLEPVRAARPVWTADGNRFAFTTTRPPSAPDQPARHALRRATPANRKVETVARSDVPFSDLHWSPEGTRLGVVRGPEGSASLHLVTTEGGFSAAINRKPVRRFAGWNAAGDRLAYVVPDQLPLPTSNAWAFLIAPDPWPRDAVVVASGSGTDPGREVFAGMRVTFPRWSPKEDKLSLWFTFSPTHRSLWSRSGIDGLPPGDPAAVFDPQTGRIDWMTVNATEKAQVGHYHLLKRNYAEAWRWYEQAAAAVPAAPPAPAGPPSFAQLARRDVSLFEVHCLTQRGREADARAKRDQFRGRFAGPFARSRPGDAFGDRLSRDGYIAEVFLSLDAAAEGERFLRAELAAAPTPEARLADAIVLAQLLLLSGDHAAYADLATDTIEPLRRQLGWAGGGFRLDLGDPKADRGTAALALLPLLAPEFVATLKPAQVAALVPRWTAHREKAADDAARLTADLFLRAAYQALGREQERQQAASRLEKNPARAAILPGGVEACVRDVRQLPAQIDTLRRLLPALR